ncbi:hypothetical protein AMECASPLE_026126 [Ameca splendens]|uniref:Uncharacterized protein n=1 Tax=Ameca splendens TaxID=208324 RepID=A0ABV1ABR1_9TELE
MEHQTQTSVLNTVALQDEDSDSKTSSCKDRSENDDVHNDLSNHWWGSGNQLLGDLTDQHTTQSVLGSSRISSQSTIESVNEEMEETFSRCDLPFSFPDEKWKKDFMKEQVTQALLKVIENILITETNTISLLDIPPASVSVEADDAKVIIESNKRYAKVYRSRVTDDKYLDRAVQTMNGATKNKQIQNNLILMVDAGLFQQNTFTVKSMV